MMSVEIVKEEIKKLNDIIDPRISLEVKLERREENTVVEDRYIVVHDMFPSNNVEINLYSAEDAGDSLNYTVSTSDLYILEAVKVAISLAEILNRKYRISDSIKVECRKLIEKSERDLKIIKRYSLDNKVVEFEAMKSVSSKLYEDMKSHILTSNSKGSKEIIEMYKDISELASKLKSELSKYQVRLSSKPISTTSKNQFEYYSICSGLCKVCEPLEIVSEVIRAC